ncbi:MAG: class I SAM-dependent methyltransferase [Victivallales bacterium]|nr:class I SAM-dependent methyltransferase [Victivallales bacterium]
MQNIYDNETFFAGYSKIRENKNSANELFEKPALFSLLPPLDGKAVIDLGCGYGEHCMEYVKRGAANVVGIDISEKMLAVAKAKNNHPKITYLNMPMEEISSIEGKFDVAASSLAIHYVEDYQALVRGIHKKLNDNGIFVFSQEHPMNTCFSDGDRWTRDENGRKLFANIANYGVEMEVESTWFIEHIKKYHRMFSTVINTLIDNGFVIEKIVEPIPTAELLKAHPEQYDLLHKPDFLLVKARKE